MIPVRHCLKLVPLCSQIRHGSRMFPQLKRGSFNRITDEDVNRFTGIVGETGIKTEELDHYNTDWLNTVSGFTELVISPKSVEEVAAVLRHCNERRLAVVPQGGNTGLVGGSNPVFDEIVLSLERLNNISHIDPYAGIVECEAGVILQNLSDKVGEHGYTVPLDLGARGSCFIGGNLATHAGGLRVVRYGQLRGSVLGMRVVLPDGQILDGRSNMRKDNTGYDIKQLFIGSEGTLGVITDVSLLLPQSPVSVNMALLGCDSFDDVIKCYRLSRQCLGEIVSACEFMDSLCMTSVNDILGLASPLENSHKFYYLVETSGMNMDHDMEKLETCIEKVFESGCATDGVMAASKDQARHMMSLRENIAPALKAVGFNYKYDVSLPIQHMYSLVEQIRNKIRLTEGAFSVGYGHLGDNNLHLNVITPHYSAQALSLIEPFVYEEVSRLKGSISAEHGMGLKKANYLRYSKDPSMIAMMRSLKDVFDPNGIMNPYKLLPWND
ncbi:hypothetical protein ACHWQZ_G014149 [Mnemiopsis leidyi]